MAARSCSFHSRATLGAHGVPLPRAHTGVLPTSELAVTTIAMHRRRARGLTRRHAQGQLAPAGMLTVQVWVTLRVPTLVAISILGVPKHWMGRAKPQATIPTATAESVRTEASGGSSCVVEPQLPPQPVTLNRLIRTPCSTWTELLADPVASGTMTSIRFLVPFGGTPRAATPMSRSPQVGTDTCVGSTAMWRCGSLIVFKRAVRAENCPESAITASDRNWPFTRICALR